MMKNGAEFVVRLILMIHSPIGQVGEEMQKPRRRAHPHVVM